MPTPYRHFRCSDDLWKAADEIARKTETTVSGLIIDYLTALTSGTIEPLSHAQREGYAATMDKETWDAVRAAATKAITHEVHMAVRTALSHMSNPLPRRAVAKTARAIVPEVNIPRPVREPVAKRLRKAAGAPVDPEKCKHEEFRQRKMQFATLCTCGAIKTETGWKLPAKKAAK
jgi:hypothetical protein